MFRTKLRDEVCQDNFRCLGRDTIKINLIFRIFVNILDPFKSSPSEAKTKIHFFNRFFGLKIQSYRHVQFSQDGNDQTKPMEYHSLMI